SPYLSAGMRRHSGFTFHCAGAVAGIQEPRVQWFPAEPKEPGRRFRASLEALAYLIARGVREHESAGQKISRISVSGGIARSDLMCEILATVLDRPLERLASAEGPALGAAVKIGRASCRERVWT